MMLREISRDSSHNCVFTGTRIYPRFIAGTAAMQQKIMKFMPLMFFLFCYTYPSALALYWTTTNIISIIQTLIIRRLPQPTLEKVDPKKQKQPKKGGFLDLMQRMMEEQQKSLEEKKRQAAMRNNGKK